MPFGKEFSGARGIGRLHAASSVQAFAFVAAHTRVLDRRRDRFAGQMVQFPMEAPPHCARLAGDIGG